MKPKGHGRILLIASIAGKEGNAGMACYSATKAGVIGLVKAVGKEFAESGITVNAIAPATIQTAMAVLWKLDAGHPVRLNPNNPNTAGQTLV